jgi:UDP-N-acetylmuramoyl-L-alanyl-D-glutamate--2,6-diaminopimelate ligase
MMLLDDILNGVELKDLTGSRAVAIASICFDSRKVEQDTLFVATVGTQVDGHQYIASAIERGAIAIVAEKLPSERVEGVTYIRVENSSQALGILAANYYDNPSEQLKLVAVTGTNGKTTVTTLLHKLYLSLGKKAGLLSTIVNKIGETEIPSTHTTPDAVSLNKLLAEMVSQGCEYCFMEASSHAIHQHRISGLCFEGALFTNISHDHLDYHKTFDEYILAKKALFDNLRSDAFALVNKDDKHGMTMLHHCKAQQHTYALKSMSDFKCKVLENQFEGLLLNIDGQEVWTKLVGQFNAYNLLAIYATAILLGEDQLQTLTAISTLGAAEGRFQTIRSDEGVVAIVDYAHTPDALKNVLKTIQAVRTNNEKLITVVGCGGDRDAEKRPLMAKIACDLSDQVILTSDNPRTEDPAAILTDMQAGVEAHQFKKTLTIADRKEAIKTACVFAEASDIILVAGKGHEKYQEIEGVKHPFDDTEELSNAFKLLQK